MVLEMEQFLVISSNKHVLKFLVDESRQDSSISGIHVTSALHKNLGILTPKIYTSMINAPTIMCLFNSQDDIVMGTLTVRENLHFSAALRLPSKMTWQQRKQRVEKVINELRLSDCASQMVCAV